MSVALAPCPFCGDVAEFERIGTRRRSCIVRCTECGTSHESADEDERSGTSWNRRASTASTAEITRLTAELAAARAVPADVEAAIVLLRRAAVRAGRTYATGSTGDGMASDDEVDHEIAALKAAIARAIAEARRPATVGGLLATAPVSDIVATLPVIECKPGPWWFQMRANGEMRSHGIGGWGAWGSSWSALAAHAKDARLVPASDADADPATRGPLPKGG